ncbi:hypothetical protein Pmar_PMAR011522 [Perkinsus marinus ATCC 50983]|uniref:Uncharacterized protein n=1 Tax=Perkinsus marinus (strain ATCC 50983 / TXsc) TaxID=423536 RepID=C5LC13_PERM5|nr:hypothetical protein Pmar_PMAR011522 [Perkinsus marinus ATCC 50983]EER05496.1 hypothetical protein Pmar_PMAR011522 [Perkinsus marinus ATCC 50983]|eukprot:XP_002773680.1 hypothetical protein Pmar_PMAR011522 [Perkinsus marinus ATCC 50983]
MGFLYELAHRHDVASLLREESSARKIFSALDRGSPSVCRRTIELISVLGRREPSFWRLLVDSIDDRPSALDSLCHLAIEGPRSVKSHAAWLISSLANYDESEAAHTLALVGALVRLLNANHGDPTVLEHALWGLTQICLDSDEVVDGLLTMGVPSIVCNLQSDRDWTGVQGQRMRAVAHLATSERLKADMLVNTAVLRILAQELETTPRANAAVGCIANLARGAPEVGEELCLLRVLPRLISLVQLNMSAIAVEAIAELALAPVIVEELMRLDAIEGLLSCTHRLLDNYQTGTKIPNSESETDPPMIQPGAYEEEDDVYIPLVVASLINRIARVAAITLEIVMSSGQFNAASRDAVLVCGGVEIIVRVADCGRSDSRTMLEVISSIRVLGRDGGSTGLAESGAMSILYSAIHERPRHATVKEEAELTLRTLPVDLQECYWRIVEKHENDERDEEMQSWMRPVRDRRKSPVEGWEPGNNPAEDADGPGSGQDTRGEEYHVASRFEDSSGSFLIILALKLSWRFTITVTLY